jgi:hypothetical protein
MVFSGLLGKMPFLFNKKMKINIKMDVFKYSRFDSSPDFFPYSLSVHQTENLQNPQ